jgi:hypothetical protein
MPRAKLLAGCLLLGLIACKHPDGENSTNSNLYGTDDPSIVLPSKANVEANADAQDLPVRQAWLQGGKVLEVHRSATCPTDNSEETIGEGSCGNETTYRFIRKSRELALSSCRCSTNLIEKKITISPTQVQELDQLVGSLEMVSSPQLVCPPDSAATDWELIIESTDAVPQIFPVALCGANGRQSGKINVQTFQALYDYLKKSLPE